MNGNNISLLEALEILISFEKELDDKLGLLTEISISTKNEAIFRACEEIRDLLCCGEIQGERPHMLPGAHPEW